MWPKKVYISGPCFHISRHQSDTSLPRLLLQLRAVLLTYWKNLLDNLKRNQCQADAGGGLGRSQGEIRRQAVELGKRGGNC